VHWPYSIDFAESFFVAQTCAALMLTALLLFWRAGSLAVRSVLFGAVWLLVAAGSIPSVVVLLGYKPWHDTFPNALAASVLLATMAAVLALRPVVAIVALVGEVPLWLVTGFVKDSDSELAGLHLAWVGLVIGLLVRASPPRTAEPARAEPERSYAVHDTIAFLGTTLLAVLVCLVVMHRRDGTADEWGYTYQAAVFAKGRLYASSPRCEPYFESFYVFENSGKLFSQYTPGWPLFLMPFVWIRAVWLAAPVTVGLLAVGAARLARSAVRSFGKWDAAPPASVIRAAGTWGALLPGVATTILINGASRYPHVYVVALYAWSLEAVFVLSTPGLSRTRQWVWGAVLGSAVVMNVASRPADGVFVGAGIAVWFLYVVARRRVGWRAFVATAAASLFWSAIVLVILRLQMGKWFTTGYALNSVIHPWNIVKYNRPLPNQWKYGLPMATGAYCWWPCSMSLGLAGLAMLRGRALGLVTAFVVGCVPYIVYMEFLDLGQRGFDWGYGPRYLIVLVLPMAVGGAVALARVTAAARERLAGGGATALSRGGPLALAMFAVVFGWIRIVAMAYPTDADHTHRHSALNRAIESAHLRNAIVVAATGTTGFSDQDLTTNLPLDLYPDQEVLIAIDKSSPHEAVACLRSAFPERRIYFASGIDPVAITTAPY
jgi:hypothetical protein